MNNKDISFVEKRIAILGGGTTNDIKNVLELFLLNYGIKPSFYESEYNQYYEEGMFLNPKLEAFKPDIIYFHISNRNITAYPDLTDDKSTVEQKINAEFEKYRILWKRVTDVYKCSIIICMIII